MYGALEHWQCVVLMIISRLRELKLKVSMVGIAWQDVCLQAMLMRATVLTGQLHVRSRYGSTIVPPYITWHCARTWRASWSTVVVYVPHCPSTSYDHLNPITPHHTTPNPPADEIRREIELETARLLGPAHLGAVSAQPIHLRITSSQVPPLTLVDLPGR